MAVLINNGGSASGLTNCSTVTNVPILQDAVAGTLWTALSATSYQALVFDQNGVLVHKMSNAFFASTPAAVTEIEGVVNGLLGL